MSKELKEIDRNCNDCSYALRSISERQKSIDFHYRLQKEEFDRKRLKMILKAESWLYNKGEKQKFKEIMKQVRRLKFEFDESSCLIHYAECTRFDHLVSFMPNRFQHDTQECFKPRIATPKN